MVLVPRDIFDEGKAKARDEKLHAEAGERPLRHDRCKANSEGRCEVQRLRRLLGPIMNVGALGA